MKTYVSSAQHCATPVPSRFAFGDQQATARRRLAEARRASTVSAATHRAHDFSPLVQEFLDDCGYTDK